MFDLTDVLALPRKDPPKWTISTRESSVAHLVAALKVHRVVFVVGGHGVGKSAHSRQAVAEIESTGVFAIHVESSSELLLGELDQLLTAATPTEQLVVAIDKPHRLTQHTLDLLDSKIRSGACSVIIECTSRNALPQTLQTLGHEVSSETREITALTEIETYDRLTEYFADSVVAESAYLLWYRTGGNQELLGKWTPDLVGTGEFKKTTYAWYWNGRTDPAGSVANHIERQYEQLSEQQQDFVQQLCLAGSMTRVEVARRVSDSDLAELQSYGILTLEQGRDSVMRVRFVASIWLEVVRTLILPARRSSIFKSLTKPTDTASDTLSDFSWSLGALEDGYHLNDFELLRAAQAAFTLHAWEFVETFVELRFPTTAETGHLIETVARTTPEHRRAALLMLLVRARAYYQTSRRDLALYDLDLCREIVEKYPEGLTDLFGEITMVYASVLRGTVGTEQRLKDLFASEIQRAHTSNDTKRATLLTIQSHSLPSVHSELGNQRGELQELFKHDNSFSSEALTVLPELIYLTAMNGKLADAVALADHALAHRALKNSLAVEHVFPWVYAEIVSARFVVSMWQGQINNGFQIPDVEAAVHLVDSAVFQTGAGRTIAYYGEWNQAKHQFEGALERFLVTDPLGRRKYALAGYVQSLAALGQYAEVNAVLKEYDASHHLTTAVVADDSDYLVLTAAYAAKHPSLAARLDDLLSRAQHNGHYWTVLKTAHLGVVTSQGKRQNAMLKTLQEAAEHVDRSFADKFLNDAIAQVSGTQGEQNKARSELLGIGVWVPQPEIGINLTRRQKQILELVVRGMTNKEIAAKLVLSVRTVDAHVSSILSRTGAEDRRELSAKIQHLL